MGGTHLGSKAVTASLGHVIAAAGAQRDYSRTPLPKKLGIKDGARVAIVNPPDGFRLSPLPDGVRIFERATEKLDVILFFAESRSHLRRRFAALAGYLTLAGGIWIAYPKKSSPKASDLDFGAVQEVGLAEGFVDNKSCAIDGTWSAVRFVLRLRDRP